MSEEKKTKRTFSAKAVAILMVMVLLIGGAIGGTMAWLIDETDEVVNTFTYGDINITLTEQDDGIKDDSGNYDYLANEYKMVPGATIKKDPTLTVKAGSEKAWIFVKLEKSGGNVTTVDPVTQATVTHTFDSFLEYDIYQSTGIADNYVWTKLDPVSAGNTEVYYALIDQSAATTDNPITIIKDNTVRVKNSVRKDMVNALDKDADGNELADADKKYPQLAITGYAVQYTAAEDATKTPAENALAAWYLAEPPVTP